MKNSLLALLIVTASIMSACSNKSDSPTETPTDVVAALISNISDSLLHDVKVTGLENVNMNMPMVLIDVRDGKNNKSWFSSGGWADTSTRRAYKKSDLFRIGSITKTFTVTEMLKLVDSGKVRLDDKLSDYVSDFPNGDNITVRMLLNMRSGIFEFSDNPSFQGDLISKSLNPPSPAGLVAYASSEPAYFAPGAGYRYSNTNTVLAGMIIEKVTGKSLEKLISEDLIAKYGLASTFFPTLPTFPNGRTNAVIGYYFINEAAPKFDVAEEFSPGWAWAAGAMISDLEDLVKWSKLLAGGAELSQAMKTERFTFGSTDDPEMQYGLGIMKIGSYYGHSGFVPGYTTTMMYSPERDVSVVVMVNFNRGTAGITTDIFKRIKNALN